MIKKWLERVVVGAIIVMLAIVSQEDVAHAVNYYGYSDSQCQTVVRDASGDNFDAVCKIPQVVAYKRHNGPCNNCPQQ